MVRIKICREKECHNSATTRGYCRLHYLKNWKSVRDAHKQVAARRLNRYIEQVCKENPENYMDVIREDLQRPDFDHYVDENFGYDEEAPLFEEGTSEEDIERLIKKLKIEEGF